MRSASWPLGASSAQPCDQLDRSVAENDCERDEPLSGVGRGLMKAESYERQPKACCGDENDDEAQDSPAKWSPGSVGTRVLVDGHAATLRARQVPVSTEEVAHGRRTPEQFSGTSLEQASGTSHESVVVAIRLNSAGCARQCNPCINVRMSCTLEK